MSTVKLLKNSGIYIFVSILQKAITFFLLPLYTAFLTPEDFGILNVILSISAFLSVLFLFSLQSAAIRYHHQNVENTEQVKKVWGTLSTFVIINSLVLGIIVLVFHKYLIDSIASKIDFYPLIFLGLLNTILSPLYLFFQSYLQAEEKGNSFGFNILANFLVNTALILIFVIGFKLGVIGILLANVITALLFFIYVCIVFLPKVKIGIDKSLIKKSLKYSIPLVPHSLSAWFTMMLDRILLNNMVGKVETGLYSVGYQFGNIINIITSSVNQAYVPWFYKNEKEGGEGYIKIQKIATLVTVFYSFSAFLISFFSKEILALMVTSEYLNSWKVIPLISFAYVFNGLYFFYVNILFLNNTKLVPLITLSSATISVLLNIILIPYYKEFGAAMSCIISIFLGSVISLYLSYKSHNELRFNWMKMYSIVFLFMLLSSTVYINVQLPFIMILSLKVIIVLLISLTIYSIYKLEVKNFLTVIIFKKNGTY